MTMNGPEDARGLSSADRRPAQGAWGGDIGDARFLNLIEANADGIIVVRGDGRIAYANPAAVELLGHDAQDLQDSVFGTPIVPGQSTEIDILAPDGEIRVAELRIVESEWDSEPALLVSLRDITERLRLEQEIRRRAEELAERDRQKNEFLSMLAHELRNPLGPIRHSIAILRHPNLTAATRGRAQDMIEHQVVVLSRLIDDLLDIARLTRGKINLKLEPVDPRDLVHQAARATQPMAEARRIVLRLHVPAEPSQILADPTRIEQILSNLLANAVKFTEPGGSIDLSLLLFPDEVELRVQDTGIGISEDVQNRIFELFVQGESSLDRSRGGLGIGLTLVRQLVELHRGRVWVHSDGLGHGSTFVVRLPRCTTAGAAAEPLAAEPARRISGDSDNRLRILIVEDNREAAESLAMLLEFSGHELQTAHDGAAGIEAALRFHPQLVLLDLGLPVLDGYEVAAKLRALTPAEFPLKIIAMTGYGQEDDFKRTRSSGFDDHMIKPIDLNQLMSWIGRWDGLGWKDTPRA